MIILDTNIISEAMRLTPEERVMRWWRAQIPQVTYTTVISEAEIFAGIALAPEGARKRDLSEAAELIFETFEGRILPFERSAARAYGRHLAVRRRAGRPVADLDAQIAAIAVCHDAVLATRNVSDFEGCGVRLVNPWTD